MKRWIRGAIVVLLTFSVLLILVSYAGSTRAPVSLGIFDANFLTVKSDSDDKKYASNLEVQISDHREAIGDFDRLNIAVERVAVHPAGMARTEGWLTFEPDTAIVDLTRVVDGPPMTILRATVSPAMYDAVRLSILDSEGALKTGDTVVVPGFEEAARLVFTLPESDTVTVLLDLVVETTEDHPGGGYEMHLRSVTVQ